VLEAFSGKLVYTGFGKTYF